MIRYSSYYGTLDLLTGAYTARKKSNSSHIYIKTGGIDTVLALNIALLADETPITLDECQSLEKGHNTVENLHLLFTSKCGAELHIVFYDDRFEVFAKNVAARNSITLCPGSRMNADVVFNPSPAVIVDHYFSISEVQRTVNGMASPPPWLLAYRQQDGRWASTALEPEMGQLDFLELETRPENNGLLGWNINLGVRPDAISTANTPPLVFRFGAEDEFATLQAHADNVLRLGKVQKPKHEFLDWQKGILACGWRYQVKLPRPAQCTQQLHEDFIAMMERNGIDFDTLIIDDFWGEQHGIWEVSKDKWPDMRGFVDKLHSQGRHVLLWICTDPVGLPPEEQLYGSFNIFSDAYKQRIARCMHTMLSDEPGCLNVDGFKFDFTSQMPGKYPPGASRNMQFLYDRFKLVTDAALAVKPDCLLDYQCCNPYFAHLHNMLRLNDYFGLPENGLEEMRTRAKVAKIVSYGALIDTDHVSFNNNPYTGGLDFFREIPAYGCPSLYLQEPDMANKELVKIVSGYKEKYLKRKK